MLVNARGGRGEEEREGDRAGMDLGRAAVPQHKLSFPFGDYTQRGGAWSAA